MKIKKMINAKLKSNLEENGEIKEIKISKNIANNFDENKIKENSTDDIETCGSVKNETVKMNVFDINQFDKEEEQHNFCSEENIYRNCKNWQQNIIKERIKMNCKHIKETIKQTKENENEKKYEKKYDKIKEVNGINEPKKIVTVKKEIKKKKKKKKTIENESLQEKQIFEISKNIKNIMNILNLPKSEILEKTPNRLAEALLYILNGYKIDVKEIFKDAMYERNYENYTVIRITGINVYSLCKHHLLPFEGFCTIEYKPNKHILGLSKFSRVIDAYSRRLQLQEDLTNDICEILKKHLKPLYIMVTIKAKHMCINMRGVKQHNSETVTQALYEWENNKYVKRSTLENGYYACVSLHDIHNDNLNEENSKKKMIKNIDILTCND